MSMDVNDTQDVQAQADRWFARLLAPDCTEQERKAFEQWRRHPGADEAYRQRERIWQQFGTPEAVADPRLLALRARTIARTAPSARVAGGNRPQGASAPAKSARRHWINWPLALAAIICALAVALCFRYFSTPAEAVYASSDVLRTIGLADGTHVQLDVGSELVVRYSDDARTVILREGRALFEVAHDAQRPFTVDLGDSQVRVLGTRFQALRDSSTVSITLDQGSLQLDGRTGNSARSERLVPGDQVDYSPQNPSAWRKQRVDSAAMVAWARGRLVFNSTPLAQAVEEVNRYARLRLRLSDPNLANLQVSGTFIAGDSEEVASIWAATLPLRMEQHGEEIVLLPVRR